MKAHLSLVSTFQNGSSFLESSRKSKLLCSSHRESLYNCLNKSCQNYAFVCQNIQCPCRQDHPNCLIVETKTITSSILAKIIPTQKISSCVEANIEKMIDELSDFREKILVDIKQRFRYCGLNQGQKDLVKKLDEGNADKVTGTLLWKAHLDFERVSDIQTNIQLSLDQINKYMLELQIHVASSCVTLQSFVKQLDDITFQIVQNNEMTLVRRKKLPQLPLKPQSNNIFLTSKILENSEEISTFLSFMPYKNIKNVILLYRASQNNFDVSKFHKNCDTMHSTLTLCTTQFNKKIGGYTPIPWTTNPSGPKTDSLKQSFIFSITNKDKLDLVQAEKAVNHSGGHGPWFGMGNDFIIQDRADKGSNSHANVNSAYRNAKYKYGDKDSWEKFGGNPNNSCCFKIKQWEVWKLEFQ